MDQALKSFKEFLKLESASGILLCIAAALACVAANSPLASYYEAFLHLQLTVTVNDFGLSKGLIHWINDGLMAIFFLLVGLEIKREVLEGELSSLSQAVLPVVAALGGVACPALIYTYFNGGDPEALRGWAIPSATDIAFSLGVLALLGSRIPFALKVFLTTVAVADDLAAIVIIALFYTEQLSVSALAVGTAGTAVLIALNRFGVRTIAAYVLVGVVIWFSVLKSGVHATLAGVIIGFCIPHRTRKDEPCLVRQMEHALHPWVAYAILPLFAFANAGISFEGISLGSLTQPVPLGIIAGLFIGKQVGIFTTAWLLIRAGFARLPEGASWRQFYGVCILAGIGFTMSLFIGTLAFEASGREAEIRLGVLSGSLLSAAIGYCWLRWATSGSAGKYTPSK